MLHAVYMCTHTIMHSNTHRLSLLSQIDCVSTKVTLIKSVVVEEVE